MTEFEDWDYSEDPVERIKMHRKTFKEFLNKRDLNTIEMDEVFLTSDQDFPDFIETEDDQTDDEEDD